MKELLHENGAVTSLSVGDCLIFEEESFSVLFTVERHGKLLEGSDGEKLRMVFSTRIPQAAIIGFCRIISATTGVDIKKDLVRSNDTKTVYIIQPPE